MSEPYTKIFVWDLPTRLFHWIIVILLGVSWLSESKDWMQLHFLSGYTLLAMLLFRIAWGFVGSETARFRQFIRAPATVFGHLARLHRREPDREIGHNPAGGWMVLLLLLLMAVQVGTGLCANDDVAREGPLAAAVGKSWSDWLTSVHGVNFTILQIAVVVHVVAVLAYAVLKRHDLVRPMVTGWKPMPDTSRTPRMASLWTAALILLIAGLAVYWLANRS